MVKRSARNQVFVSYSHRDKYWLERLQVHLRPLERRGLLVRWDDTRIAAGQRWRQEIKAAIDAAAVAILLVSPDFLASDFIDNDELPPLLKAAEEEGTVVLPLIISPCAFSRTPSLSQFQAVNPPSETLKGMTEAQQDQTFDNLAIRVQELLNELSKGTAIREEPPEEEVAAEGVFHPAKAAASRGPLVECKFYISPFYRKTGLWHKLADVLVVLEKVAVGSDAYLIPSGAANPHLSDAKFLRTEEGREWLDVKRRATAEFVKKNKNRLIKGSRFTMRTGTGERTKVYAPEYDRFLNAALGGLGEKDGAVP
jgi:hypothetical protein